MNQLTVISHSNQRILTTAQLAEAYEATEKAISNNFNNNKDRYIEGKHYYCLQGEELKDFLHSSNLGLQNQGKIRNLYLWTEKGAFLHAKSLNTDKAWQLYEELVDHYFKAQENQQPIQQLSPQLQLLINMELEQKKMQQQLNQVNHHALEAKAQAEEVKQEIDGMRDVMTLDHDNWRKECNNILNKIAKERGGTKEAYKEVRDEAYKLTEHRAAANLKQRVTNKQDRLRREGTGKSKIDAVSQIDVIAEDKRLKEIYIAIVKEIAIKYGVA